MFDTLVDSVKAQIEEKTYSNTVTIKGWSFCQNKGVCPVRCKYEGTIKLVDIITREDICKKFNNNKIILCGWIVEVPINKYCDMQIKINSEWNTFLSFNTFDSIQNTVENKTETKNESETKNEIVNLDEFITAAIKDFKQKYPNTNLDNPKITTLDLSTINNLPSTIIIDNFYTHPNDVREIMLSSDDNIHTGLFTPFLKSTIEQTFNSTISSLDKCIYTNSFKTANDHIEITTTKHKYCAVVFLTPNAPINSGITLYRSKYTNKMLVLSSEESTVFKNGHQDITEFEPVDTISNIFNRLVIFNSNLLHSATNNFGNDKLNGRLTQEFYFDLN